MKKIVLFILLALVLSPLKSCKKDEDPPTKKELLTDGMWIGITQETYIDDVLSETHQIPFLRYDFKSDNTVLFDNNDDDIFETRTWSFQSDETKLKLAGSAVDLLVLTDKRLVFSVEFAPQTGGIGEWVQTFGH